MRATWAPRGHTPVLRHHFRWTRLSMAAAIGYRDEQTALVFQIGPGAYDTASLIDYLTDLHTHFGAEKVTLVWDGLPSHRSTDMKTWIARQRCWLVVERLPAYAPELNPVEGLWGNVKGRELANLCPDTIDDAHAAAHTGLTRAGTDADLCHALLAHTGLSW